MRIALSLVARPGSVNKALIELEIFTLGHGGKLHPRRAFGIGSKQRKLPQHQTDLAVFSDQLGQSGGALPAIGAVRVVERDHAHIAVGVAGHEARWRAEDLLGIHANRPLLADLQLCHLAPRL
jgi:hypothetical protein